VPPLAGLRHWRISSTRLHAVVETADYVQDARRAGLTDDERSAIVDQLALDPDAGVLIPGTGGARKLRLAGRGRGKSGGYRVITYFAGQDLPVFLLNVFAKGERVDLTQAERNALRRELAGLAEDYRLGPHTSQERR
jgi:hypothetical protein